MPEGVAEALEALEGTAEEERKRGREKREKRSFDRLRKRAQQAEKIIIPIKSQIEAID
jgi:hypothetical protein